LAFVTGNEGRQWLYTALTRGAQSNQVIVCTPPPKLAEPQPGTRSAPELSRQARIDRERAGLPAARHSPLTSPEPREPRAVLADVLAHDETQESALETSRRELADADHLGRLGAVWDGETAEARRDLYRAAVRDALPPEYQSVSLDGGQATWLWRTLRGAEAAGLDVRDVVARAVAERTLEGIRDLPSVLDARIRDRLGSVAPAPLRRWSERVPECADPARGRFLRAIAEAMDDRKARLGEFAAEHSPAWAVNALGPVPEDPVDRLEWEQRASHIAAYREQYGYEHETEPVGPEPVNSPDARASWFAAYGSITRADEAGLDRLPDGSLWHMRSTYAAETAWAPRYVGHELRQVRAAGLRASADAARADAEAAVARRDGDAERARRHEHLAASARAALAFYSDRADLDEQLMTDRQEWAERTAGPRLLAVQADSALRRRHPDLEIEPLASAEPDPAPDELPAVTAVRPAITVPARRALRRRVATVIALQPCRRRAVEAAPPAAAVAARLSRCPSAWRYPAGPPGRGCGEAGSWRAGLAAGACSGLVSALATWRTKARIVPWATWRRTARSRAAPTAPSGGR
jgi:hypothetical protein